MPVASFSTIVSSRFSNASLPCTKMYESMAMRTEPRARTTASEKSMSNVIGLPCSSSVPVSISSAASPAPALVSYVAAKSTAVVSGVPSACSPKLISTSIPSTAISIPLNPTTAAASAVARTAVHVSVPAVIFTTAKSTPVSARPIADPLTEPSAFSNGPLIPTNADASVTASVSIETVTIEPSLSVTSCPTRDSKAKAPRAKKKPPMLISTVALKFRV